VSEKQAEDPELRAYLAALGARVREARAKRGMARRILARHSGVSERYLAQLEGGTGNPTVAVLRQIAKAVDYPVGDLVADGASPTGARPELAPLVAKLQALAPDLLPEARAALEQVGTGPCSPAGLATAKAGRIALIGLRGAGKSTLGRHLAERLEVPFVELNRLVEHEYGGSIGEILALSGQAAFRRLERRVLEATIAEHPTAVIATGGGLVSEPETFRVLLDRCHTVWIQASPAEHMERVIAQGDLRPMAKNDEAMDDLKAILAAREPAYRQADAALDTTGRTIEESVTALDIEARKLLR
jgi:XRE family aerobic/anaerobic benzoate catabolism transcriptional regulator